VHVDDRQAGRGTVTVMVTGVAVLTAATVAGGMGERNLPLDLVVGVLAVVLTPLLVRWPVHGTVALSVLALLSPAATPAATCGALIVAQRRRLPVAVGVGVVGLAAHLAQGLLRPAGGLSFGWWAVLVTCAYAALVAWGALNQARWALLCSLRDRARRAEEERDRRVAEARAAERTRIAHEMHDVLAHRLTLVATYAGALEYRPDAPAEQVAKAAGVVRAGVHLALEELRDVIGVLRTGDGGARPTPVFADVPRLLDEARGVGQQVSFTDTIDGTPPDAVGRTVYRLVQEGLSNARRHAAGRPVTVQLTGRPGAEVCVHIENETAGTGATASPGTGLIGLAERVELAGGRFDHETTGGVFHLRARLPWPE
jgi:signal transduction histidine kinase